MPDLIADATTAEPAQNGVVNGFSALKRDPGAPPSPVSQPSSEREPIWPEEDAEEPESEAPVRNPVEGGPAPTRSNAPPDVRQEVGEHKADPDDSPSTQEDTPTSDDPDTRLLHEHALLGSLLYAPASLDTIDTFLRARDFSTPETRALYATIRGLHRSGSLFDVAALTTETKRQQAASENDLRLFAALRAKVPTYSTIRISNPHAAVAKITSLAPAESVAYRGVHDVASQLDMARMVLRDSIWRKLRGMGVQMTRRRPTVAATAASVRSGRAIDSMVGNLENIQIHLDAMAARLAKATKYAPAESTNRHESEPASPIAPRSDSAIGRFPGKVRSFAGPVRQRAERHLIHLALYAGRMRNVPSEILDIEPESFSSRQHANTWRIIQEIRAQNRPVNFISVIREIQASPHGPALSNRVLVGMAKPPMVKPTRVARSLRVLVSTALSRAQKASQTAIEVASADPTLPVEAALDQVSREVSGLATRARTAVQQHQTMSTRHQNGRNTR